MENAKCRIVHRSAQSEYILSDATQIDESVLKTDEVVVPELSKKHFKFTEVTEFSFGEEIKRKN